MIVVSAQLTDWQETSARQANALCDYFIENFSVDANRVYAAGYSAGGETMSQAVAMRPDLYAAYLHGASQWDGDYDSTAQNHIAVYIFVYHIPRSACKSQPFALPYGVVPITFVSPDDVAGFFF